MSFSISPISFEHNLLSSIVIRSDIERTARKRLFSKIRAVVAWTAQELEICSLTQVANYFNKDLSTLTEGITRLTTKKETLSELEAILHFFLNNPTTQA